MWILYAMVFNSTFSCRATLVACSVNKDKLEDYKRNIDLSKYDSALQEASLFIEWVDLI